MNDVFPTLSFHSIGSRKSVRGRSGRGLYLWQHGGDMKKRFSIHFDTNSNEFTQLERTGHVYLRPQQAPHSHIPVPPHVSQASLNPTQFS